MILKFNSSNYWIPIHPVICATDVTPWDLLSIELYHQKEIFSSLLRGTGDLVIPKSTHPLQHPPETLAHTQKGEANKAAVFFQIRQMYTQKKFPKTFCHFSAKCINYTGLPASVCMHPPIQRIPGIFLCEHQLENNISACVSRFLKRVLTSSTQVKASIIDKSMVIKPKVNMKSRSIKRIHEKQIHEKYP